MDTTIRILRNEINEGEAGGLNAPHHPVQQEVARETSMPLLPKNCASHLLRGECWIVRIGKSVQNSGGSKTKKGKTPQK